MTYLEFVHKFETVIYQRLHTKARAFKTQNEMAKHFDMSTSTLSRILNANSADYFLKHREQIEKILGFNIMSYDITDNYITRFDVIGNKDTGVLFGVVEEINSEEGLYKVRLDGTRGMYVFLTDEIIASNNLVVIGNARYKE